MLDSRLNPHRLKLPDWARRDHPLVARELALLPPFFSAKAAPLRTAITRMALLGLIFAPCTCLCGGFPWQLVLLPLGWLPLIWAAPILGHEVSARRWDVLRATPYSPRQIVLAKLSAVLYRLSPLLGFILVGQAVYMALAVLAWVMLTNTFSLNLYVSVNSTALERNSLFPAGTLAPGGIIGLGSLMLVLTLLATLLDFVTNAACGALASTLTDRRGMTYVGAFGLRAALALLYFLLALWTVGLVAGRTISPLEPLVDAALAGAPGWAMIVMPNSVAGPLWVGVATVAGQAAALAGILSLTFWRAARL